MKINALRSVCSSLKDIYRYADDSRFNILYAEYSAALRLARLGMTVEIAGERQDKSADLYIPKRKIRVEVKSGEMMEYDAAFASFGNGSQIRKKKFDYCVFVPFEDNQPKEFLVFSFDDLSEVKKRRPSLAAHPKTNPCLLSRFYDKAQMSHFFRRRHAKPLKIELEVIDHSNKFLDAWTKIIEQSESRK